MPIKVNNTTIIENPRFFTNVSKFSISTTSANPGDYNSNIATGGDTNSVVSIVDSNVTLIKTGAPAGEFKIQAISDTSSTTLGDMYPSFSVINCCNVAGSAGEFQFHKTGLDVNLNKTIPGSDDSIMGDVIARCWNGTTWANAAYIEFKLNSRNITGSGNHPSGNIRFIGRSSTYTSATGGTELATFEGNNAGNFLMNSGYGSIFVNYGVRAWVHFVGTATPITLSGNGNVSSITDNGTGNYTINFTNALPDANYTTCGGGRRSADIGSAEAIPQISFSNYATTSVKIGSQDNDNNNYLDSSDMTAVIVR